MSKRTWYVEGKWSNYVEVEDNGFGEEISRQAAMRYLEARFNEKDFMRSLDVREADARDAEETIIVLDDFGGYIFNNE